jgi:hypothetical protein
MTTPKLTLTKDALRALRLCWNSAQLEASLALWPDDTVSWRWFLGRHLAGMSREGAALRLQVALMMVQHAHIRLPMPRSQIQYKLARESLGGWLAVLRLLAAYLDAAPRAQPAALEALKTRLRFETGEHIADMHELIEFTYDEGCAE